MAGAERMRGRERKEVSKGLVGGRRHLGFYSGDGEML